VARAEAMGVQGLNDGPGPFLHGAESYKPVIFWTRTTVENSKPTPLIKKK